jgi:hypothetical protein
MPLFIHAQGRKGVLHKRGLHSGKLCGHEFVEGIRICIYYAKKPPPLDAMIASLDEISGFRQHCRIEILATDVTDVAFMQHRGSISDAIMPPPCSKRLCGISYFYRTTLGMNDTKERE